VRHRPVWYTLLPALFMLVTSVYSLVYLLIMKYLPGQPKTTPLVVTTIIVLAMTTGVIVAAVMRFVRTWRGAAVPA
jgi:carbon starvation protein